MRKFIALTILALAVFPMIGNSAQAGQVTLKAMSILASNHATAPMDERLEKVEFALRRILGFEYYHFLAEGSVMLNLPGESTLGLNNGYYLELQAWDAGKNRVRAEVKWFDSRRLLLKTAVVLSRGGKPAVLGGVPHKDGKSIIVLTAE